MSLRLRAAFALAVLATGAISSAQQAPSQQQAGGDATELAALYTRGMAEFQAGDYARAAADLEALCNRAEVTPQLEPAFFTTGSAWFNSGDFKKAIDAYKRYQAKFPNGAHANEVAYALAQSNLQAKNYAEAATQFAALEKDPRMRDQALYWSASASKEAGKNDQAIATLEKLTGTALKTPMAARGAMLLAQLYAKKGESAKTIALIKKLHEAIGLVENLVELNALTVELGDELYKSKAYGDALECYRAAYPREQIVRLQTARLTAMQARIDNNLATARNDPAMASSVLADNQQLKADIGRTQSLLTEFEKLPTITPAIYIRLARCFYEVDRKWESIVVYQEIVDRFGKISEREPALFGLIVALADVNQPQKAQARCEEYLRDFNTGPNADTVGYLLGAVALQANDPRTAETYFGRMLETQPTSTFRDQMRFLLANAKFMGGKHDEAAAEYKKYLSEFPNGQNVEDANYRLCLTNLFSGKYQDALNGLQDYLKKYPSGQFVSDAKYRIAVCKYAASLYDEVINDCKSWERDFPNNKQLGEVLALLGDALAASSHENDAIPVYVRSYKLAATDEVMNYSLFAASKLLQKRDEWERVSDLFNEFIQEKPDHPTVISAIFWIGKAKARAGKYDEAKKIAADTIKKYIGDPNREAIELLLSQLAQLCVKKKKPVEAAVAVEGGAPATPAPNQAANASPTPAAVAVEAGAPATTLSPAGSPEVAPPSDPGAELDRLLGSVEQDQNPTARARVLYAKAELARLRKQPAEEEANIAKIAEFKPDDLSPVLLGRAGDYLLSKDKLDAAAGFYQRLMDEYPKSDNLDFAYAGLGEIALRKKDNRAALQYFTDGTDKIAAQQKLKEITLGKARALLALDKLDEAKKVFEQVASVREWRGEATAFSVYSLGDIEAKRGKWAEANAYFQRVYVGYQKFLPWVAKAYIRSAECFEKLNRQEEAANTYREMLRNEKLASFAETIEAKKRLEAMGQQG